VFLFLDIYTKNNEKEAQIKVGEVRFRLPSINMIQMLYQTSILLLFPIQLP